MEPSVDCPGHTGSSGSRDAALAFWPFLSHGPRCEALGGAAVAQAWGWRAERTNTEEHVPGAGAMLGTWHIVRHLTTARTLGGQVSQMAKYREVKELAQRDAMSKW